MTPSDANAVPAARDSRGRDARIHGIVLSESSPAPTLRELLRQYHEQFHDQAPGDLGERTAKVLEIIGPDGVAVD